jgi:hypothetical protein
VTPWLEGTAVEFLDRHAQRDAGDVEQRRPSDLALMPHHVAAVLAVGNRPDAIT